MTTDTSSLRQRGGPDGPRRPPYSTIPEGTRFAERYLVKRLIGSGGMGDVYLAFDELLGEGDPVALKLLRADLCADERLARRFLREVQLTRKVTHLNVIRTFEVGQFGERLYFTMEYVEGVSLRDRINSEPVPVEEAQLILLQIAQGLAAIHESGIVHRDLKPANIMLIPGGPLKIADFGVAWNGWSSLTRENEMVGSAPYMAPELWTGRDIGTSADLYALGVVAYELLTGIIPFDADSAAEMMCKHLEATPPHPSQIVPSIPQELDALVVSLLKKSPLERPTSTVEVLRWLEGQHSSITVRGEVTTEIDPTSISIPTDSTLGEGFDLLAPPAESLYDSTTHDIPAPPSFASSDLTQYEVEAPPQRKRFVLTSAGRMVAGALLVFVTFCLSSILALEIWKAGAQSPAVALITLLGAAFVAPLGSLPLLWICVTLIGFRRGLKAWMKIAGILFGFFLVILSLNMLNFRVVPTKLFTSLQPRTVQQMVEIASVNTFELAALSPVPSAYDVEDQDGMRMLVKIRNAGSVRQTIYIVLTVFYLVIAVSVMVKAVSTAHDISSPAGAAMLFLTLLPYAIYLAVRAHGDLGTTGFFSALTLLVGPLKITTDPIALASCAVSWILFAVLARTVMGRASDFD